MYASLNAGFSRATGEIFGWLNDSDKLHTRGLFVVGSVFLDLPQVDWITGRPTLFNEQGMTVEIGNIPHWSRYRFLAGANRYIQQESTFWRRTLWDKAGGRLDDSGRCGHVADFELWVRFFRHAPIFPVDALIGGFRADRNSRSLKGMAIHHQFQDEIIATELNAAPWGKSIRLFRRIDQMLGNVPKVRWFWQRFISSRLYRPQGADLPPVIRYEQDHWILSPQ
jgi:hypothetical protein